MDKTAKDWSAPVSGRKGLKRCSAEASSPVLLCMNSEKHGLSFWSVEENKTWSRNRFALVALFPFQAHETSRRFRLRLCFISSVEQRGGDAVTVFNKPMRRAEGGNTAGRFSHIMGFKSCLKHSSSLKVSAVSRSLGCAASHLHVSRLKYLLLLTVRPLRNH